MKIAIGSDHAGFALKERLKNYLIKLNYEVKDFGTHSEESVDYPDIAFEVSRDVSNGKFDRGILICGTGIGMCIAANKVVGIRAAICWDERTAKLSRKHNDSNILCLGGRILDEEEALKIVDVWLTTEFEGGRHLRRIKKISEYERTSALC
ncbi:MAG TPA: ribose 5-phosphate isomerase B [Candidatus Korarchaeota archaeon]|nr:ribose 5-phosphate isomerase B [Candidatus Korarchaeota archaeon]